MGRVKKCYDVDNVGNGCSIELGRGKCELGSSHVSLQSTFSPLSVSLSSPSYSSAIVVEDGVDFLVGSEVTLSLDDVKLFGGVILSI